MRFRKNGRYFLLALSAVCLLVLNACAVREGYQVPVEKEAVERHGAPDESRQAEIQAPPGPGVIEMISGKWRRSQSGDMIEFLRDGTGKFYSPVDKAVYPWTYRIDDDTHITTELGQGGSITWGFVVSKNELQLKAPSGLVLKYKKVP